MDCSTPGLPVYHQFLKPAQAHVHCIGDAIQPFRPLLSASPLAFNLSSIRVFSNESALHIRWPNIGVSVSTSVLPMNTQDWSPLGWTGWISLKSKGLSRIFSNTRVQKHQFFGAQLFFIVQLSHPYMTTGKTIALTRRTFVDKVMSLLLNMLSRLVITFLPRRKRLLISWLQSPSDFEAQKNKVSHCFPIYLPWSDGTGCHDLSFLNVEL